MKEPTLRKKTSVTFVTPMLLSALLLSACGSAAAASAPESASQTAAENAAQDSSAASADADAANAAQTGSAASADADAANAGSTAVSPTPTNREIYDALYGDLRDVYAMETYDEVPEYFSEQHDDVDYGTVETDVRYWSETAGDYKYCNVLLPAGYDESQEYPVLYMFHGFGGQYDSHVHEGSILATLYGNMLHEGLAVPMIIVGADMYTDLLSEKDGKSDAEMRPCYDKAVDDIEKDLMPFIEERYSVKKGRMNAAVTGVSQGATTALAIAFKWQAKIAYVGSFAPCPGVIPTGFYSGSFWNTPILDDFSIDSPRTMPRYIYLTVGSEDPWCIDSTVYYGKVMDEKGIPNQNDLVEGYDHGNDMWELGHYNFLQKIFLDGQD